MNRAEQTFDDWARRGRDVGMEEGHLPRARRLLERMALEEGARCLDLGCGNGWAGRWMLDHQKGELHSVTGIDIARTMIAKAQEAAPDRARYLRASLESLPFGDSEFHEAFSMEALYYSTELEACLGEIFRVLKPGGRLFFGTDFYEENPYSESWPRDLDVPMTRLSQAGWCEAFKSAGFSETETFRSHDPRPPKADLDERSRREEEDFRRNIGTLAIIVTR